ncbi:Fc.00g082410.m01.CDS01 [Cosmosporella sp. VM-42]
MGCPLKAITKRSERFFDNVTISFQKWSAPYSSKHGPKLPFDLAYRTFRLATGATREIWFIVMHPVRPNATGRPRRGAPSAHGTALAKHEAEPLASYIKSVFLSGELLGEGIEPSWTLGGQQSQSITHNKWTAFQELFMDGWGDFVERYSHDPFWAENQPAFHAYDYGANIEIEVTEQVQSLEREARIRPDEDDEDEDEDEVENDGDDDDTEEEELYESDNPEDGDGPGDLGSRRGISASTTRIESPGLVVERNDRRGGEASLEGGMRDASASFEDGSERHESTPIPPSQREAQEALYSSGLRELRAELEQKYNIVHLESVSYALAVNLYCTAADSSSRGGGEEEAVCLLADRNCLAREFATYRDYTFYPLGFHPAYGNFSSPEPPAFLNNNMLAIMKDNMSFQNQGKEVLSAGYFQAYSGIKTAIRPRASDLLASQGSATAALTVPSSDVEATARIKAKQQRLLRRLRGQLTPGDPDASTPFARERRRIEATIDEEEFSFRFEQVMSIRVSNLVPERRDFVNVLQPIFQLMRFFLKEKQFYSWILRRFPPKVFPGILTAYAKTFEMAIGEMERRFTADGARGLGLALSEAVAALDRLGNFCFTGDS